MENHTTIEVDHVYKSFRNVEVLKDITLTCESGHIYGIVGHNGSGKSVLFKCICGCYGCTKGSVRIDGKTMGKDIDVLSNAGIIIEDPGYLRRWSAYRNLQFLYTIRNRNDRDYLYRVLEQVGLDPHLKKPVGKYSLGMKQRLAIAQAIMEDPPILILDEPMNGLDREGVEQMRDLFSAKKEEGKLMLLASHNREDIDILCDEVYQMEDGEMKRLR